MSNRLDTRRGRQHSLSTLLPAGRDRSLPGLQPTVGGIKTYQDFQAMIDAGATRIGTSASVKIIQQAQSR